MRVDQKVILQTKKATHKSLPLVLASNKTGILFLFMKN